MFINTLRKIREFLIQCSTFKVEIIYFFTGGIKRCLHCDPYHMLIFMNHSLFYKQRIWKVSENVIMVWKHVFFANESDGIVRQRSASGSWRPRIPGQEGQTGLIAGALLGPGQHLLHVCDHVGDNSPHSSRNVHLLRIHGGHGVSMGVMEGEIFIQVVKETGAWRDKRKDS